MNPIEGLLYFLDRMVRIATKYSSFFGQGVMNTLITT